MTVLLRRTGPHHGPGPSHQPEPKPSSSALANLRLSSSPRASSVHSSRTPRQRIQFLGASVSPEPQLIQNSTSAHRYLHPAFLEFHGQARSRWFHFISKIWNSIELYQLHSTVLEFPINLEAINSAHCPRILPYHSRTVDNSTPWS